MTPNSRGEPFPRALLGPIERRALRIGVDQGDSFPFPAPFAGEMQGQCRLADAALLVEQRDDHRALVPVIHRSRRVPTSEGLDSFRLDSKLGASEVSEFLMKMRFSVPDSTSPRFPIARARGS